MLCNLVGSLLRKKYMGLGFGLGFGLDMCWGFGLCGGFCLIGGMGCFVGGMSFILKWEDVGYDCIDESKLMCREVKW